LEPFAFALVGLCFWADFWGHPKNEGATGSQWALRIWTFFSLFWIRMFLFRHFHGSLTR